jgi:hypothetical protein
MSDDNNSDTIEVTLPTTSGGLGNVTSALLQEIAKDPGSVDSISIAIKLSQPALPDQSDIVPGTLVRQALSSSDVVTTWIPDNPSQNSERASVSDQDLAHDKQNWQDLLGLDNPPEIDIDTGIALLRMFPDGKTSLAAWCPNDASASVITNFVEQSNGGNGPGLDFGAFWTCVREKGGGVGALNQCLNHLI